MKYNAALAKVQFYEDLVVKLRSQIRLHKLVKAQVELEERIANLPPDAKQRLREAFPSTDIAGLKEAINVERRLGNKQDDRVDRILGTDDRRLEK